MLLLIIRIRFTCGERKIWQNIKNSQNIMTIVVISIDGFIDKHLRKTSLYEFILNSINFMLKSVVLYNYLVIPLPMYLVGIFELR